MLKHRLADLRAAACVNDLIVGNPRELNRKNFQQYILDLVDGYGLIFCANHNTNPQLSCGKTDWSKVSRIKILNIGKIND